MQILAIISAVSFGLIVLIWIGYPVAIWLISRIYRRPIQPEYGASITRTVSVVLATRDTADAIEARLRNLLDTDHPSDLLEVIVSLDADGALAAPGDFTALDSRVKIVAGDVPGGKACALNAGVRAATGEVLVMADAAQRFDRRTIPELVACMEDLRFGAVSGELELGRENGRTSPVHWYWAMEKWLRYNESLIHSSVGVTGAVYATRRETWPAIPAGTILDDVYVPMVMVLNGFRVGFRKQALAFDVRKIAIGSETKRKQRTLTGILQLSALISGLFGTNNPIALQFFLHKYCRLATPFLLAVAVLAFSAILGTLLLELSATSVLASLLLAIVVLIPQTNRTRALSFLRWGIAIQASIVSAIANGLGRKWSVWERPEK